MNNACNGRAFYIMKTGYFIDENILQTQSTQMPEMEQPYFTQTGYSLIKFTEYPMDTNYSLIHAQQWPQNLLI